MRIVVFIFFFIFSLFLVPSPGFAKNYADPVNSSISASTKSVPADGATTATISVTVKDSQKNPLVGDHITLTSTADSGLIINGGAAGANRHTAATDTNGKVNFTVSSRNISPGTVTLTATDTSDIPPVTLGSVRITFTPASLAPDPSCHDSAPVSAPMLKSAVSHSSHQITLTWTEASDPVSYYLVAYGTSPKQYIYGNPNVGGKRTTSYTVGSLVNGITYYFVVRAGNGCAPGPYSNELAAVAGGIITRTPTSTFTPIPNSPTLAPITTTAIPTETPLPQPIAPAAKSTSTDKVLPYILELILRILHLF